MIDLFGITKETKGANSILKISLRFHDIITSTTDLTILSSLIYGAVKQQSLLIDKKQIREKLSSSINFPLSAQYHILTIKLNSEIEIESLNFHIPNIDLPLNTPQN